MNPLSSGVRAFTHRWPDPAMRRTPLGTPHIKLFLLDNIMSIEEPVDHLSSHPSPSLNGVPSMEAPVTPCDVAASIDMRRIA